jgi:hypothetical protein
MPCGTAIFRAAIFWRLVVFGNTGNDSRPRLGSAADNRKSCFAGLSPSAKTMPDAAQLFGT